VTVARREQDQITGVELDGSPSTRRA
jgi:hypothetical protein